MDNCIFILIIFLHLAFTSDSPEENEDWPTDQDIRMFVGPLAGYNFADEIDAAVQTPPQTPPNQPSQPGPGMPGPSRMTGDISPFNFPEPNPLPPSQFQLSPDSSHISPLSVDLRGQSVPPPRPPVPAVREAPEYPFNFPDPQPLFASAFETGSPCALVLGRDENGRYPKEIAREFLEDTVRPAEPGRNMFCRCLDNETMECRIIVPDNSLEQQVVNRRLDSSDPEALRPFWVAVQRADRPFMYHDHTSVPPIYCIIIVEVEQMPARFSRSQSDPYLYRYPSRTIPVTQCTENNPGAVCPITQQPFTHNQIVYVLKSERSKVKQGLPVSCISAEGLRKYSRMKEGQFKDPLKREGDKMLNIKDNYHAYTITTQTTRNRNTQTDITGPDMDRLFDNFLRLRDESSDGKLGVASSRTKPLFELSTSSKSSLLLFFGSLFSVYCYLKKREKKTSSPRTQLI